MSHNHCIRLSLGLKDKNIMFDPNFCEERRNKGVTSLLYFATLTYRPTHCQCCGVVNEGFTVVKNGFLTL